MGVRKSIGFPTWNGKKKRACKTACKLFFVLNSLEKRQNSVGNPCQEKYTFLNVFRPARHPESTLASFIIAYPHFKKIGKFRQLLDDFCIEIVLKKQKNRKNSPKVASGRRKNGWREKAHRLKSKTEKPETFEKSVCPTLVRIFRDAPSYSFSEEKRPQTRADGVRRSV